MRPLTAVVHSLVVSSAVHAASPTDPCTATKLEKACDLSTCHAHSRSLMTALDTCLRTCRRASPRPARAHPAPVHEQPQAERRARATKRHRTRRDRSRSGTGSNSGLMKRRVETMLLRVLADAHGAGKLRGRELSPACREVLHAAGFLPYHGSLKISQKIVRLLKLCCP